ncbi:MAG TPA: RluA family pseudouridine synthase [Candidatus Merdenecus merdavium]|nr:RluA family pseudouridine synthase [Candidatus Merdenecus merdavium]
MVNHFTYPIKQEHAGLSISDFLKSMGYSRKVIIHLKKTEYGIMVNGTWAYVNHILKSGECLQIKLVEESSSTHILPAPVPFDIIFEDEHILVINKPANTPIHPSMGNHENTLANGVAYYYQNKGIPFVYRCINRLDRDTTGLLIVAKHQLSSCILSDMIKDRTIHREYLALALGKVPEAGTINAPIGRVPGSTIERCIDTINGETALTHYRLVEYKKATDLSLVALTLETGRTHQIRVHMKHIGHPLIGDYLYHPVYSKISRQALHSYCLKFDHPITKTKLCFYAPLPEDMKNCL